MIEQITFKLNEAEYELYMQIENNYIIDAQKRFNTVRIYHERKHSKKCTFYTLRFGCSFAAVNTIKPQLL